MVFTTNQTKHFYVLSDKNTIAVKDTADKKGIYFKYEGPGGALRSDIIKKDKVQYAKFTPASAMSTTPKAVRITLDSNVNEGKPVIGQDYIFTIIFKNYFGPDETHTYIKQAAVRAFDNDAETFYKKLAISLARNFARDIVKPLSVFVAKGVLDIVEVTATTKLSDLDLSNVSCIVLMEKEQPWTLGVEAQTPINFEVSFSPITFEGSERIWGKSDKLDDSFVLTITSSNPWPNSKKIADMEYFYAKERGDIYGNIGWPNNVKTTYVANPELTSGYDVIDIHYSYVGANESIQMSEKDVTIAAPAGTLETLKSELEGEGIEFA